MSVFGAVKVDDEITAVLEAFDVDRIVVGHTPQKDGIAVLHDARLIVIDTWAWLPTMAGSTPSWRSRHLGFSPTMTACAALLRGSTRAADTG